MRALSLCRILILLCALATFFSCQADQAQPQPPLRDCTKTVWVRAPNATSVFLSGTWNQWSPTTPVPFAGEGWFKAVLSLPPGDQGYWVVVDGKEQLDERNPLTTFHGAQEVSLLLAEDCTIPEVRVEDVKASDDGTFSVRATFLSASGGATVAPASVQAQLRDGTSLTLDGVDKNTGKISFSAKGLAQGKHVATISASDTAGKGAAPARAVGWVRAAAPTWQDGLLYQIMIDRFRGDGGAVLSAPKTPGHRAGGTLDGIRAEIEKGTFEKLGVSVLWISPVYVNPTEMREGSGGHLYEAYHGYWPLDNRKVDTALGGEAALDSLVSAAHRHGLRLLLDIVPNHIYETNPRFLERQGTDWFHDKCVCGAPECPWSTHIETCWFVPYLPDYRFENQEAMNLAIEDSVWWSDRFDLDGVRIDAVPMMPRATTRRIANALRTSWTPRSDKFLLGEVFTGAGESGLATIRYFLGPDTLDSAFDFPLLWAMREAIAANRTGFEPLEDSLHANEVALEGSGAVLARTLGNHDTTRFLSEAVGDASGDAWAEPAAVQPVEQTPYRKQAMALAMLLTLPGMPVIYYGDEIGLAGRGDPDCRRVMPAIETLSSDRLRLLEQTQRLGRFRVCSKALRKGARVALQVTHDTYVYRRDAGDEWPVIVALSKAATAIDLQLGGNVLPPGVYLDVVSGEQVPVGVQGAGQAVRVEPLSARVLVLASSPCLP